MSEIFLKYTSKTGFVRCDDKSKLSGKILSYADFKTESASIKPGSTDEYGVILTKADVQEFIANYEVDSVFTQDEIN